MKEKEKKKNKKNLIKMNTQLAVYIKEKYNTWREIVKCICGGALNMQRHISNCQLRIISLRQIISLRPTIIEYLMSG